MTCVTIWIDADACPKAMKEMIYRAAMRTKTTFVLVANSYIHTPASPWIKTVQVETQFDSADAYIVSEINPGDLVITSDIPLAAEILEKGGHVISQRGEVYSKNDIQQRLTMRDVNEQLRSYGAASGGPSALGNREKMRFGNALDSWLQKYAL